MRDPSTIARDFDVRAMFDAMDTERRRRDLSWRDVAKEMWAQSDVLNARRVDHPISPSTLSGIAARGNCSCQHALFVLRWLGRAPEHFVVPSRPAARDEALPLAGADRRLRWNLEALYDALEQRREEHALSWRAVARQVHCSESQLRGLRTVRYAIAMRLAMRIVTWLDRPAAAFIFPEEW